MNLKELKGNIRKYLCRDCDFDIELNNNYVYFYLNSYDGREVCSVEIPYNNIKERKEIYEKIDKLIRIFDFSFRVSFDTIDDLRSFVGAVHMYQRMNL